MSKFESFARESRRKQDDQEDRHNIVLPQKLSKIYVISIANIDKTWQYSFQTTDTLSIA